jgi:hypothetical protein
MAGLLVREMPALAGASRRAKRPTWSRRPEVRGATRSGRGEALRYVQGQREALERTLPDGRLKPDFNSAEDRLRAVAVARKSWRLAGSLSGARRAPTFADTTA